MQKQKIKNKKISKSLKRFYRLQRGESKLKIFKHYLLWSMIIAAVLGFYSEHKPFEATQVDAPYAQMWNRLPEIPERTDLTDKDEMFIASYWDCQRRDLGFECIDDIMGMSFKESKFDCDAVGDFGASHGCLQIHLGFHPEITQKDAREPEFAVKWTLDRMQHFGYPEYRSRAIMKHNGTPGTPKTLAYLSAVNNY